MNDYRFSLADAELVALASGCLWLPEQRTLVVADLHFGKAERMARREGRLTPPYEARETLARLAGEVDRLRPEQVICLGDSFDDDSAADALDADIRIGLARLMAGRKWIWIAGNHDPAPTGMGGTCQAEFRIGGLHFQHIASPGGVCTGDTGTGARGEISGHYHPKAWLKGRGRPAFVLDRSRLILPAFGAYTGGLDVTDEVFDGLFAPDALVLMTGAKVIAAPRARLPKRGRRAPAPRRP